MSVATEIQRIISARNDIRTYLANTLHLGGATDNIGQIATTITGISYKGSPTATVGIGESYTIQAGYYAGGTVTGDAGSGTYDLQTKTVTPTTSQITVTPDSGKYGLSSVTVNQIPNNYKDVSSTTATADKVLQSYTFVASNGTLTAGTMENKGAVTGTFDGLNTLSYTIPAGYHNGSGTVTLTNDIETSLASI